MKKVLAMMLILTMLSSTAAMCFADQGMDVSLSTVSMVKIDVRDTLDHDDEKMSQKQELMDSLDSLKNDTSLTFKDKVVRFWESVKDFVKKHYIKIGIVTGTLAITVIALVFGSDIADYIKDLFTNSDSEPRTELTGEQNERITKAKEAFTPIFNKINKILSMDANEIEIMPLLKEDELKIRKFERAFWEYGSNDTLVGHLYKDLLNYANADIVALIKLKENNKIVDEFLAATGCLKEYEAERRYLPVKEAFAPIYDKINAILNLLDDSKIVVDTQLSEQDKEKIEKFERAWEDYYCITNEVIEFDYINRELADYATDELLEIVRNEENNKIVDEFLAITE